VAPIRTENDKYEFVSAVSTTKRLLHIGKRICGWLEQITIRVRFDGTGTTNNEA